MLILGSGSPRRLELLKTVGYAPADVLSSDIDESVLPKELAGTYVLRLAREKGEALRNKAAGKFLLTADTTVVRGRTIIGKPKDEGEAAKFLDLLSGRRHTVMTGVCLITPAGKTCTRLVKSTVQFKRLTIKEKQSYLAGGEWRGKAGGYAIQGRGALFIQQIIGSYTNVVGLPVFEVGQLLKGEGLWPTL